MEQLNYQTFVDVFYQELFTAIPRLEERFPDKARQRSMLVIVMKLIQDLENNIALQDGYLEVLAIKHRQINLTDEEIQFGEEAFKIAINKSCVHCTNKRKEELFNLFKRIFSDIKDNG